MEILYIYCNIPYSRSSGAAFSVSGAIGRDWMGKKVVGRAGDLDAVRLGLGVSGVLGFVAEGGGDEIIVSDCQTSNCARGVSKYEVCTGLCSAKKMK